MKRQFFYSWLVGSALFCCAATYAQQTAAITIDAANLENEVSPNLHGIFFEEISHGGDGGLYAELIQNRGFEESQLPQATTLENGFVVPRRTPHFSMPNRGVSDWKMEWPYKSAWPAWSLETGPSAKIQLALTQQKPLNKATPNSLQIDIDALDKGGQNNLVNDGYWGINVVQGARYNLTFYTHTNAQYNGPLTVSLQAQNGTVLATYRFPKISSQDWKKHTCTLQANASDPKAKFVISFGSTGTVWLDFVSLFPATTFKNRPNGLRADLAQYLADLKPAFIRWPGGCFVEGINVESAPNWRTALGPVEQRAATFSPWGYWSTNGFGYHEYLQFCEDIGADALYVFNIGVSCDFRSGTYIEDVGVDSIINDVLDGIEYAIGPPTSKWGKVRAKAGHPAPFPLRYVEVGNEQYGPRYAERYNRFYTAIKQKYPQLQLIASMGIGAVNTHTTDSMKATDIADEHAYKGANWAMRNWDYFDKYGRGKWDLYVGEYATNAGVGSGNMLAALNDAVYIMGMEKNSDLVKMSSYAPLLVNVHDVDWPVNLINFDAAKSFGRISYYTIKLFNEQRADQNLATQVQLFQKPIQQPQFAGGIGLATWDTRAEYKDLQVLKGGTVIYHSDFVNRATEWNGIRGDWKTKDSAFVQTAMGAQQFAWLQGKSFDTYTLKLKARKLDTLMNAFIIPFAVKDSNTMLRAHIGSWLNTHATFESVSKGYDVADLVAQQKLPAHIEAGQWYDITLEVGVDSVSCYLDGKLLMRYSEPRRFFSIAGKDKESGDVIIKVVNGYAEACQTKLQVNNMSVADSAQVFTLAAPTLEAENSMENPTKFMPVETTISSIKNQVDVAFPPYSITVLRLKSKRVR